MVVSSIFVPIMLSLVSYFDLLCSRTLQDYLRLNEDVDVQKLILKEKDIQGVPAKYIAQLIAGRQKIKRKLPSWWARTELLYPPSLNLEQASSEATGKFKGELVASICPNHARGVDLTGGFGVDTFFLSKYFSHFDYVEKDTQLFDIAKQNFKTLEATGVESHLSSAEDFIAATKNTFDLIYIDPSRRRGSQKVFKLRDCEPDVPKLQDNLFSKSDVIVMKASPLLDIQQGASELKNVVEVIVIAVDNECRELLFVMRKGFHGEFGIKAIDLKSDGSVVRQLALKKSDELNSAVAFSPPLSFLYEPGAAILKAGAFKWISQEFNTPKLAPSTHLYTSQSQTAFPGRTFKILESAKLDKSIKERFKNGYANILVRNYPLSVEEIKKKTGLQEGGEQYLICTQDRNEKLVLIAEKV
jgi:16S rRNA G966 N2-methylase RsmD